MNEREYRAQEGEGAESKMQYIVHFLYTDSKKTSKERVGQLLQMRQSP
jgi:hypothetical protein